jgi:hypothetical protein
MRGGAEQGERASNCEALVVKAQAAQIRRLCGEGSRSYLGRSRLIPERATVLSRSEKSAEAIVAARRRAEGIGGGAFWFSDLECLRCSHSEARQYGL